MARVGVFGGTFNPPHIGHVTCVAAAFEQLGLDRVIIVPVGEPALKRQPDGVAAEDRLTMAKLAFLEGPELAVSRIELDRPGPSYSHATLESLQRDHPEDELSFIVGGDTAASLPQWKSPQEVLRLASFAVAERSGVKRHQIVSAFRELGAEQRLRFFEMPRVDVSSSLIRDRLAAGESVAGLLPAKVIDYIEARGLYR